MNILYFVSAAGNRLYEGRYELYGRYMTYGKQSFILFEERSAVGLEAVECLRGS